VEQISFFI